MEMMKFTEMEVKLIRRLFKYYTIVALALIAIITMKYAYDNVINPPKYTICGKIRLKSNEEVKIKHGTKTKLYLGVDFDNGNFEAVEVSPTVYFDYSKDNRICFTRKYEKDGMFDAILSVIGLLCMVICLLVCVVMLVMGILWMLNIKLK